MERVTVDSLRHHALHLRVRLGGENAVPTHRPSSPQTEAKLRLVSYQGSDEKIIFNFDHDQRASNPAQLEAVRKAANIGQEKKNSLFDQNHQNLVLHALI